MRVLVTGGAGFIGSHVVRALSSRMQVVCLDDLSSGSRNNLENVDVELLEGSILDPSALTRAMDGVKAVVHLAARPSVPRSILDPVATHDVNATGTLRVLEAARHLDDPLVIVASSSSVYGANSTLPKQEDLVAAPMSPYAASKLASEQYAIAWQRSYGLRTLALRFFNVFGPRQTPDHAYAAAVPSFVAAALRGEPLRIHGDGSQTRDFTFVSTVSDVIVGAVVEDVTYDAPINLAFGTRSSILDVVHEIESLIGRPLTRLHVDARTGDVPHSQADNKRLRSLFPLVEPINLVDGLRQTIDWMQGYLSAEASHVR